jgi:hypothetical protein
VSHSISVPLKILGVLITHSIFDSGCDDNLIDLKEYQRLPSVPKRVIRTKDRTHKLLTANGMPL